MWALLKPATLQIKSIVTFAACFSLRLTPCKAHVQGAFPKYKMGLVLGPLIWNAPTFYFFPPRMCWSMGLTKTWAFLIKSCGAQVLSYISRLFLTTPLALPITKDETPRFVYIFLNNSTGKLPVLQFILRKVLKTAGISNVTSVWF